MREGAPVWCDLHVHSDHSDGEFPPTRVVDMAADSGVGVIALTDHDTTAGHAAAAARAAQRGIEFVGGIEMTAYAGGRVVHVLGLGVAHGDAELQALNATAKRVWGANQRRFVESIEAEGAAVRFERDFPDGPALLPELVRRLCSRGVDGGDPRRVHARFREFFAALPAEAYAQLPSPAGAAAAIRAAGGVSVLAHPLRIAEDGVAARLADDVDAIEAIYAPYEPEEREALAALAAAKRKLVTCGTDYHGFWNGPYVNPRFALPSPLAARLGIEV